MISPQLEELRTLFLKVGVEDGAAQEFANTVFDYFPELIAHIEQLEAENAALKGVLQAQWDNMPLEWKLHFDSRRAILQDTAIAAQSPVTDK